jgi:chromosome partitioning protein
MAKNKPAQRQIRIAICSNAGGSGKTTLATHLAYGVAIRGYKTTIIELDHNGSLATFTGIPPATPESSISSVLRKDFDGSYPLVPLWTESVKTINVIQGGAPLEESFTELYNSSRRHYLLADRLEDIPLDSNLVIFDTPASLEPMGLLALAACTHVLAPIKPEYKDSSALAALLQWYYSKCTELRLKPRPPFLGFVPARVNFDAAIHRNLLGLTKAGKPNERIDPAETLTYQIQQIGIHCFPPIRESNYYLWACGAGLPLHLYRPGNEFVKDFDPIVAKVVQLLTSKED